MVIDLLFEIEVGLLGRGVEVVWCLLFAIGLTVLLLD